MEIADHVYHSNLFRTAHMQERLRLTSMGTSLVLCPLACAAFLRS